MDILARRGLLPPSGIERAQGLGRMPAQRADQLSVVLVRDLPRAVVELKLFERGEGSITLLQELQPFPFAGGQVREPVVLRLGLPQERPCDDRHTGKREQDGQDHGGQGHAGV
jgi:hypothetical protein